jgi:hypothetical protein
MEWNGSALGIHPRVRLHKKEEWNRSLKPNILPRCGTEWFHRIGGMCWRPPGEASDGALVEQAGGQPGRRESIDGGRE